MPKTNYLLWFALSLMLFAAQWYIHDLDDFVALITGKLVVEAARVEMIIASIAFFLLVGWLLHYAILIITSWFMHEK